MLIGSSERGNPGDESAKIKAKTGLLDVFDKKRSTGVVKRSQAQWLQIKIKNRKNTYGVKMPDVCVIED